MTTGEHVPRAAADVIGEDGRLHTTINQHVAATGRLSTSNPNLQAIPIRTEFRARDPLRLRRGARSPPALGGLLADRTPNPGSRLGRAEAARGVPPRRGHPYGNGLEVLGKDPATLTKAERNVAKMINFGIVYGISAFGLSENLDIPKEQAQAYIDAYLARFEGAGVHRADDRPGLGRVRDEPARPTPAGA